MGSLYFLINYTHFKNNTYDNIYETAMHTTSDSARYKLYKEMDNIIIDPDCKGLISQSIDEPYECENTGHIAIGPDLTVTSPDGYLKLSGETIGFTGVVSVKLGGRLAVVDP